MADSESDGMPIGPAVGPRDLEAAAECLAAQARRYAECIAQGMSVKHATWEGVGAAAECRRVQLGLPAKPEPDFHVPPAQRLRFDASGRLIPPKKARR
jgi:hypothetical protein